MKNIIPVLTHAAILLLGLFVGIYIGNRSALNHTDNNSGLLAKHSDYAYETYLGGNIAASNIALLDYLDKLNFSIKSSEVQSKAASMDKVLTLGRLAALANASEQPDEEKKYLNLAITVCNELKSENCTEAGIRERVSRIDRLRKSKG